MILTTHISNIFPYPFQTSAAFQQTNLPKLQIRHTPHDNFTDNYNLWLTVQWLRLLLTLLRFFLTLTEVFPCVFLSCKANAKVKLAKTGHGPHSSTLFVICVVRLLFVLFSVLFVCICVLPPGDNPIAVNKCISYHIASGRYKSQNNSVRKKTNCHFPISLSLSLSKVKHILTFWHWIFTFKF
jgi:hypothetical protein